MGRSGSTDHPFERADVSAHRVADRRKAHRRGWMVGDKVSPTAIHAELTMDLRQPMAAAKDLSKRLRPEQHDDARIDQVDLPIEPALLARLQLIVPGWAVPGWPTLDAVRDEHPVA